MARWSDDEDEERFVCDKFDDCRFCRHKFDEWTCDDCDVGENFEEEDPDEVDKDFRY